MSAGMLGSSSSTYLKVVDTVNLKGDLQNYPLNQWKKVFELKGKYLITMLYFIPGQASSARFRITVDGASFEKDFGYINSNNQGFLYFVYPVLSNLNQNDNSAYLQEMYVDKSIKIEVMQTTRYEINYAQAHLKAALIEIGEIES
ncbi:MULTISPECIES: hypothetical protein [unclassified Vibrio]|uniref:hypothetical protein n=2 Tax=Vibrio TaxID=662 RepID=UPI000B8E3229|nr:MULTISPECIES: hypothetical protein [unclassified Vibrio]NAX44233.1 hypothetical protein [Vibrio sp. V25_P4S6T154]OXX41844.1 hypothetical protein B9J93_19165 [Vibrio sp. V17_P4S1T151]OXX60703.1 hypothetical protein B9J89_17025 [Vibrio sp. V15_P4S5T153]